MLARAMVKAAFGIILFVMGASVASAASLGVSPVRVTLIREPVDGRTHRA